MQIQFSAPVTVIIPSSEKFQNSIQKLVRDGKLLIREIFSLHFCNQFAPSKVSMPLKRNGPLRIKENKSLKGTGNQILNMKQRIDFYNFSKDRFFLEYKKRKSCLLSLATLLLFSSQLFKNISSFYPTYPDNMVFLLHPYYPLQFIK